jgi:probable H4MPT-linked C1 transfer pathway protein
LSFREPVLGWDLGGAHLKAVLVDGSGAATFALELPCPLWQGLGHLDRAVGETLARLAAQPAVHAVTMTGELADCFPDRSAGVAALARTMAAHVPGGSLRFFAGRRGFLPASDVADAVSAIASANWLATAMFTAETVKQALLVDIGSTTVDLVPVANRTTLAVGYDDFTRLAADELVYTGVVRTPVMSLAHRIPFEGQVVGVMAEHFATAADVYRLTGDLSEAADLHPTADGGPKTIEGSARRLARVVGRDVASAPLDAWKRLAGFFAECQLERLVDAASRLLARSPLSSQAPVVGAGVGGFLARRLAARLGLPYVDFATLVPLAGASAETVMACAPAFAVARLLYVPARETRR